MELTNEKIRQMQLRLLQSRLRVLLRHGFYGILLMHLQMKLDPFCETAYTDAQTIAFCPKFLENISDSELDFIMMHEIMHVVLGHCFRGKNLDDGLFNVACDIVVNSNIWKYNNYDTKSITLDYYGESFYKLPNKQNGFDYTAEEVYEMIVNDPKYQKYKSNKNNKKESKNNSGNTADKSNQDNPLWDNHSQWSREEIGDQATIWTQRIIDAATSVERQKETMGVGGVPPIIERQLYELKNPQTDWRILLDDFIQEEICDYSFNPPDRRFSETEFFLPDYNDKDYEVADILFMIDTSGSINDRMLSVAYTEIKSAIDQFDGKLQGWLGFFDSDVVEPKPFSGNEDFSKIKAYGGGGTSFKMIFDYVNSQMQDKLPKSIVILTDGLCEFPDQSVTNGIPVLWIINNDFITPPWGKVARIKMYN